MHDVAWCDSWRNAFSDRPPLQKSQTHIGYSLTAVLDQLRVVASSTSNDPGPRSRQHQTDRPVSSSNCCSQFIRGRPGGRFQSAAGGVPVWASIDSCSACKAGVFSSHRLQEYKLFSSASSIVNGGDKAKTGSSHRLQEYTCSTVCLLLWMLEIKQKRLSHRLQKYKCSPVCLLLWMVEIVNGKDEAKRFPHRLQEYKVSCSVSSIVNGGDEAKRSSHRL